MDNQQHDNSEQQNQKQAQPSDKVTPTTSGLAVAGLVLGILAILGAFVPLLNFGAIPFALVGLVLAMAGFVGIKNGKHTGRGIAIAGIVLGAVSLVVIIGMYGCAAIVTSAPSSSSSSTASLTASTSAPSSTVPMEADRTTVGPVSFNLPKGWVSQKDDNGQQYFYPSKADHTSLMYIASESAELPEGESESSYLDGVAKSAINAIGDFNIVEATDSSVSGYPAKRVKAEGLVKNTGMSMALQMRLVKAPGYVIAFIGGSKDGRYDTEIAACLDSMTVQQIASSNAAQSSQGVSEGSYQSSADDGAVSPDLKEALDSYEAFMDEYVEFMERYADSDDTTSMLNDYLSYLQKYSELMAKIEAIDANSLSAADYAYYIDVTSRVSKKLLEASM